jgi:hypothetical protein
VDPEIAQRLDDLNAVIWTLSALIVALCAYIVRLPEVRDSGPHCPLHRCPPHKCVDRHKLG